MPQAVLLVAFALRFGRDLPFCIFLQTLGFVAFNKVCTAQYFIWYHALIPLILPSSSALLKTERARTAVVVAMWVATLLLWLGIAHQLEFRARNVFTPLWLASLAFFCANVLLVHETIRLHHATPLFRGGRLARQACLYGAEAEETGATAASERAGAPTAPLGHDAIDGARLRVAGLRLRQVRAHISTEGGLLRHRTAARVRPTTTRLAALGP